MDCDDKVAGPLEPFREVAAEAKRTLEQNVNPTLDVWKAVGEDVRRVLAKIEKFLP